jgi:Cof subfamily protein (haloacid dehalogenase superfamily)
MNKTIVALDMDGTTLNDQKTISPETIEYFQYLQSKGVIIVLNSGRPFRALRHYYQEMGLTGPVVCLNGGMIISPRDNEKVLYKKTYPKDLITNAVDKMGMEAFANILVDDYTALYLAYDNNFLEGYIHKEGMKVVYGNRFKEIPDDPVGAIFSLKDSKDMFRLFELTGHSYPGIGFRYWGNSADGELYFHHENKFTGLARVAELEHVRIEDIIAFGDDENDIEMIAKCGIGVGMKGGTENIKKYADLMSLDDNNHDGVMKTLKLLLAGI